MSNYGFTEILILSKGGGAKMTWEMRLQAKDFGMCEVPLGEYLRNGIEKLIDDLRRGTPLKMEHPDE